jgi:hypothetical protein
MKTKHGILFGIAALLAAAIVLFAACGGGGGSSGPKVDIPSVSDVPALPGGTTPVTTANVEWIEALLDDLEGILDNIYDDLEDAVYTAAEDKGDNPDELPFNFTGDINMSGFSGITSGELTVTVHEDFSGNETYGSFSRTIDSTVKTTIVTAYSGPQIWEGSVFSEAAAAAGSEKSGKQTVAQAYGLTVTYEGKSAKIIYSSTSTYTENTSGWTWSEKGKVTVYGEDDVKVYEIPIDNKDSDTYDEPGSYKSVNKSARRLF